MTEIELLQCFRRNGNGTWSALKSITVGGVTMGPGVSFSRGVSFSGVDVAHLLDQLAIKYPWAVQT